MRGMKKVWLGVLVLGCLVASAENAPRLSGQILKDNRGEFLGFDFKVGDDKVEYHVEGNTMADKGVYRSDKNYGGVRVTKYTNGRDGTVRKQGYRNSGTMRVYPRKRKIDGELLIADVPISGEFLQGMFDDGVWVDKLTVDGTQSRGVLDYIRVNGRYRALRDLSFGNCGISSTLPKSKIVLNYDNAFIGQNRFRVSMNFGSLVLNGQIQFSDVERVIGAGEDATTFVASTTARMNIPLVKADGTALKLAAFGQPETDDDKVVRKLIAFLTLLGYDLFAQ